jgi:hypothetical protein
VSCQIMSVPRSVVAVIALVKPLSGVNSRVPVELPLVVGVVRAECARKPPFCKHVQLVYGLRSTRWSLIAGEDALSSFPMAVLLCWSIVTTGRSFSRPQRRRASNLVSRAGAPSLLLLLLLLLLLFMMLLLPMMLLVLALALAVLV